MADDYSLQKSSSSSSIEEEITIKFKTSSSNNEEYKPSDNFEKKIISHEYGYYYLRVYDEDLLVLKKKLIELDRQRFLSRRFYYTKKEARFIICPKCNIHRFDPCKGKFQQCYKCSIEMVSDSHKRGIEANIRIPKPYKPIEVKANDFEKMNIDSKIDSKFADGSSLLKLTDEEMDECKKALNYNYKKKGAKNVRKPKEQLKNAPKVRRKRIHLTLY